MDDDEVIPPDTEVVVDADADADVDVDGEDTEEEDNGVVVAAKWSGTAAGDSWNGPLAMVLFIH